jgi:hypothetical protein
MLEFVLHSEQLNHQEWQEAKGRLRGLPLEIKSPELTHLEYEQGNRGLIFLKCQREIAEEFCPTLINGHINPKFKS